LRLFAVVVLFVLWSWGPALWAGGPHLRPEVRLGADTLLTDPAPLTGKRVGLVTHLAGTTAAGDLTAAALARTPGVRLTALFAPEHGFDGSAGAGVPVTSTHLGGAPGAILPSRTPVYSLYGGAFRPTRQMLARVDVLVVDLQDAGTRPYTYASTMALVMAAAREADKPVVVLDRPNPLGGTVVDGPVLEPAFRSFIGLYPIPLVHGMTLGELARLYNDAFGIGAQLTVVPMQGWSRTMPWTETGLPWVNPSPGLTHADAPFYYAATGPLDGTNLWNGVATTSRFQVVLAPWMDGERLAARLNRRGLPGVRFSPSAVPHPRTGRVWRGVRLHVTDRAAFRPAATIVYVLAEIRDLHPGQLRFRLPRRGRALFDVVWGTKQVRVDLTRGLPAETIVARWQPALRRFEALRSRYLLYK
jgi:uncharacterized protein YbbC (DUF1343 family)